ncbi:uncharacterized protein LOC144148902 isoform X3 [Haemaphysalis longicornis]
MGAASWTGASCHDWMSKSDLIMASQPLCDASFTQLGECWAPWWRGSAPTTWPRASWTAASTSRRCAQEQQGGHCGTLRGTCCGSRHARSLFPVLPSLAVRAI